MLSFFSTIPLQTVLSMLTAGLSTLSDQESAHKHLVHNDTYMVPSHNHNIPPCFHTQKCITHILNIQLVHLKIELTC